MVDDHPVLIGSAKWLAGEHIIFGGAVAACRSLLSGLVLFAVIVTAINASSLAVAAHGGFNTPASSLTTSPTPSDSLQDERPPSAEGSEIGLPDDSSRVRLYVEPVFSGQASLELDRIGNEVNEFISLHPHTFSGGYFSSDSSKVMVGVAEPSHEAASAFEELADRLDPGRRQVATIEAQWSWSELDSVKNRLVEEYLRQAKGGVDSVGLNTVLNTVVVAVEIKPGDPALKDNPTVIEIAERYGDSVMFRASAGPVIMNSSIDDVDPHFGGAGYEWYDSAGNKTSGHCSIAFPINLNNVTYGLTAGHCRPGTATNRVHAYSLAGVDSRRYFGSLYTTTWVGTQDSYGDFALLKNSTYAPFVYSSTRTSNDFLWVVEASFNFPMTGQNMCSSGVTTGQKCRYKVVATNQCKLADGQPVCEQFVMKSDQNLDRAYDCFGWEDGDSGGAVYNAVSGGVRAYGIVSAFTEQQCFAPREYQATSLHGVRKWKPLASMPLAN